MKRTDLLSALGMIDKSYLDRAFERVETEESSADDEIIAQVGIMDKKNYVCKKMEFVVAISVSLLICFGMLIILAINDKKLKEDLQSMASKISTTVTEESRTSDIEPYVSGDRLYFGVRTVNYTNPDTDYLLNAVIYDNENPHEPIEVLSKSCLKVDIASGVESDVLIDLYYDECPENMLIKCTFCTYITGNYNDQASTQWEFNFKYIKSENDAP